VEPAQVPVLRFAVSLRGGLPDFGGTAKVIPRFRVDTGFGSPARQFREIATAGLRDLGATETFRPSGVLAWARRSRSVAPAMDSAGTQYRLDSLLWAKRTRRCRQVIETTARIAEATG